MFFHEKQTAPLVLLPPSQSSYLKKVKFKLFFRIFINKLSHNKKKYEILYNFLNKMDSRVKKVK